MLDVSKICHSVHLLQSLTSSSSGGLEVELWTDNSLPFASVDQIPLGAMYL